MLVGTLGHLRQALRQLFRHRIAQAQVDALGQRDVGRLERTTARTQDGARGRALVHQHQHGGHHGLGLQRVQDLRREQRFGHARGRRGRQGVDVDVVFGPFDGQRLHQAHLGQLGGTIVGLAEVAIQPGGRSGHQNASVLLRHHVRPHGLAAVGRAHEVHIHHQAEIRHVHLGERLVAQDAGVVHQNVHAAPGVDGLLHHGLDRSKIRHRRAVGQRLAPCRADFVHHRLRRRHRAAATIHRATQVVDQHLGAALGQRQRMLAAQAAAGARHDGHAALEIQFHAAFTPVS